MPTRFIRLTSAAALLIPFLTLPVKADPGVGIGFSYVFGEGASIGLKVFSDDEEDTGAAEIGIDYVFPSQSWRPHVGVAYLADDYYVDLNVGYSFAPQAWNLAMGAGYTNTDEDKKTSTTTESVTESETESITDSEIVVDTAPETDLVPEGETDLVAKLF
jgi:hypothetical protein